MIKPNNKYRALNYLMTTGSGRCLFAGIWFAAAGFIPVAYYLLRFGDGLPILGGSIVLTALIPTFISGFMGLVLGSNILYPEETKTEFKAIGFGFSVAALSFFLLFVVPAILTFSVSGDIFGTVAAFAIFFLYGLMMVGWLAAIVGAAAGGLLYLFRLKMMKRLGVSQEL